MKLLITGAGGFIGNHLAEYLAGRHQVYGLTRTLPSGRSNVSWIEGDLTGSWPPLPPVDAVIHLAQSRHYRDFPEKAADIFGVNVKSTFELLEWARKHEVKRFIYTSTGGIYGHGEREFVEDKKIFFGEEGNFYRATKYAAELFVNDYADFFATITLRLFFVYGPGQRLSMLMPRLTESVMDGRPIELHGADGIKINPIYVDDVVRAIERSLDLDGNHKINIGGSEVLTLRDVGQEIGRVLGKEANFVETGQEPRHLIGDIGKMRRLLCAPEVSFDTGIAKVCADVAARTSKR